jgi:hypothetical protein
MNMHHRSAEVCKLSNPADRLPTRVRAIGYWMDDDVPNLPDPAVFVDPDWDVNERIAVASYLNGGRPVSLGCGCSPCRMCGAPNGFEDFTDGVFQWPEGLAHYILDHSVRLPDEVVEHIRRQAHRSDTVGVVDTTWWINATH